MLRCVECDVSITSCSCVVQRSRFPSAAVHDVALSSDAQARYDEARRVEARGRELARAFVASGRPVLSCPPKFAVEVRATIASIARLAFLSSASAAREVGPSIGTTGPRGATRRPGRVRALRRAGENP